MSSSASRRRLITLAGRQGVVARAGLILLQGGDPLQQARAVAVLALVGGHRLQLDLGSRTYSHDFKRLAAPNRVREADFGTALLVYGRLPPAWVQLRPWHRDRRLKEMVNGAQATHPTPAPPPAPAPAPEPAPAREGAT